MGLIPRSHKGTIKRASGTTRVAGGGRVPTFATIDTDVPCNMQPERTLGRSGLGQTAFGVNISGEHVGYFPPGTDIRAKDLFTITEGDYVPLELRVVHVGIEPGDWVDGTKPDVEVRLENENA